jgi:YHS domain-containing protein
MIRTLVYLLLGIFVITVVRMLAGVVLKGFSEAMKGASSGGAAGGTGQPRPPNPPTTGELKRDPVCGTFVPMSTQFQKTVRGEVRYFCSAECRDKFA